MTLSMTVTEVAGPRPALAAKLENLANRRENQTCGYTLELALVKGRCKSTLPWSPLAFSALTWHFAHLLGSDFRLTALDHFPLLQITGKTRKSEAS